MYSMSELTRVIRDWQYKVVTHLMKEMVLDSTLGWVAGDDLRVLIASGIGVSGYNLGQIRVDMNYLGGISPEAVGNVQDLLDGYDEVQVKMNELNSNSESRVLKKADVLEWEAGEIGSVYGPERELGRIRELLSQYFGFSVLFGSNLGNGSIGLVRS